MRSVLSTTARNVARKLAAGEHITRIAGKVIAELDAHGLAVQAESFAGRHGDRQHYALDLKKFRARMTELGIEWWGKP